MPIEFMPDSTLNMFESTMTGITLRQLCQPQEIQMCVDVQKTVWGFSDLEVVPLRMFVVAVRTGGQVTGAFDGERALQKARGGLCVGPIVPHAAMLAKTSGYPHAAGRSIPHE